LHSFPTRRSSDLRSTRERENGLSDRRGGADSCTAGLQERATGFEPVTSSLGSWHSTPELRPQAQQSVNLVANQKKGEAVRISSYETVHRLAAMDSSGRPN